jgi:hypothetical protein
MTKIPRPTGRAIAYATSEVLKLHLHIVMAGLVPAIHVFSVRNQDVDARHKAGHDEFVETAARPHMR